MRVMQVKKTDLKELIGKIVPWNYEPRIGENVFVVYIDGTIPIKIKSKLTEEEFSRIC